MAAIHRVRKRLVLERIYEASKRVSFPVADHFVPRRKSPLVTCVFPLSLLIGYVEVSCG